MVSQSGVADSLDSGCADPVVCVESFCSLVFRDRRVLEDRFFFGRVSNSRLSVGVIEVFIW